MSGLIWAGIGKGIADAGQSFASAGMKQLEMDRQDEREILREERLLKRQEALDELKATRERTREEELQQRVINESAAVSTKANEIGTAREGRAFDRLAESSAMAGEQGDVALSKEQLQKLAKDDPALGEQYKKMGLVESSMPLTANQKRMQRADDEVQASMDIGAHSSVQKSLMDKRKSVLDEIREENKETDRKVERQQNNRRLDLIEERIASQTKIGQQNADANTKRADKPAGGGSDNNDRDITAAENALSSTRARIEKGYREPTMQEKYDPVALEAYTRKRNEFVDNHPDVKRQSDRVTRLNSGGGAPAAPATPKSGDNSKPAATISGLPKGATQIGTSGGKPVYQTPDGKKFISN
jgi:hypothetical protein